MTSQTVAIAVFVKTPGYSPLKTRLAAEIGTEQAEQFHRLATRCLEETLIDLQQEMSDRKVNIKPVWSIAEPDAFSDPLWSRFERMGQGSGDLGNRLHYVYSKLFATHDGVVLMGADSPQLNSSTIRTAIEALFLHDAPPYLMIPANDGGFVLFGGTRSVRQECWMQVPYSVSETAEELIAALADSGTTRCLHREIDVDTRDDLFLLLPKLEGSPATSSRQTMYQWIQQQLSN